MTYNRIMMVAKIRSEGRFAMQLSRYFTIKRALTPAMDVGYANPSVLEKPGRRAGQRHPRPLVR